MFYLGIDVSKNKIDCCFFYEKDSQKKKNKIFPNQAKGFDALNLWLSNLKVDPQQTIALMEATSVYHEPLAEFLFLKVLKSALLILHEQDILHKVCPSLIKRIK